MREQHHQHEHISLLQTFGAVKPFLPSLGCKSLGTVFPKTLEGWLCQPLELFTLQDQHPVGSPQNRQPLRGSGKFLAFRNRSANLAPSLAAKASVGVGITPASQHLEPAASKPEIKACFMASLEVLVSLPTTTLP
jgi:hypothetical protein